MYRWKLHTCHVGGQNQFVPAAGEENFAFWVQNRDVRAVWGVRKWCWLPKSGVSQAYSNTWPRAGVSLGQHLAHLSVSLPVLTPVKRWKRSPAHTPLHHPTLRVGQPSRCMAPDDATDTTCDATDTTRHNSRLHTGYGDSAALMAVWRSATSRGAGVHCVLPL